MQGHSDGRVLGRRMNMDVLSKIGLLAKRQNVGTRELREPGYSLGSKCLPIAHMIKTLSQDSAILRLEP